MMARSKVSNSRSGQLIIVVLLISALAGANCDVNIINYSSSYFSVFGVSTPIQDPTFAPKTGPIVLPVYAPPAGIVAVPETFFFYQYTSPPNATMNISGVKEIFLTAFVYNNATITLNDGNAPGVVGFKIDYPN